MKITGEWGCGSDCGTSNTQKWGPNSIYDIKCKKCDTPVEFFRDEKKRSCPKCGEKKPHQAGLACQEEKRPKCGAKMLREGSYHHQLLKKKKKSERQSYKPLKGDE